MKIEPGKLYKTREGQKARVYAVDGEKMNSVHGARLVHGAWVFTLWDEHGRYSLIGESYRDLVSEWRDEPRVFWVNVYPNMGDRLFLYSYLTRREADLNARHDRIECIRVVEQPEGETK